MTQDEKDADLNILEKDVGKQDRSNRRGGLTKVVIRRLPPSMKEDDFLEQVSPLPEFDSMYYVFADSSMSGNSFGRAYIAFRGQQEILEFKDKWDGYVFLDERGQEYPAIVEFAPFQKMPRKKPKKVDNKCGTLEQDADYQSFLETMDDEEQIQLPSMETTVEELEKRDRELKANNGVPNVLTPLIEFVLQKKMDRLRMREEKREEKKKRDQEKRKLRDEKKRSKKQPPFKGPREAAIREEEEDDYEEIPGNASGEEDRGDANDMAEKPKKRNNRRGNRNGPRDKNERAPEALREDEALPRQKKNPPNRRNGDENEQIPEIPRGNRKPRNDGEGYRDEEGGAPRPGRRERRMRDVPRNDVNDNRTEKPSGSAQNLEDRPGERQERPRRDRDRRQRQKPQQPRDGRKAEQAPQPTSKRYSENRCAPAQPRQEPRETGDAGPGCSEVVSEKQTRNREPRNAKTRNRDRPTQEIYKPGSKRKGGGNADRNRENDQE